MTLSPPDHKAAAKCGVSNLRFNNAVNYITDRSIYPVIIILIVSYCFFGPIAGME